MVSSVVLRPERAAYLESQVAASYADYVGGRGEALGEWHGKAAVLLGLGKDVQPGDLAALIDGHNPRTDERLVRRPKPRAYEIDAFDPETGVVAKTQRVAHPVGGFDFTFSAPKSLSLAHALAEPAVARQVRAAHDAAVRAALTMLEDEACFTRLGASGAAKARGVGIAAALFAHRTSRAEDPQLHTHCAIINLTRPVDEERWRTLDSATLLRRWKLTLGYAYQAHLRAEITTRLGWSFAPVHKGMAEIAQLDPELLRAFSQRRAQIERHAETHGTSHQALQLAALETRPAKPEPRLVTELKAEWRARASAQGYDETRLGVLFESAASSIPERDAREIEGLFRALAGPEGLTEKRTVFDRSDVIRTLAEHAPAGATTHELQGQADRLLARDDLVVPLADGHATTRDLLSHEQTLLALADEAAKRPLPPLPDQAIKAALAGRTLDHEQRLLVEGIARDGSALISVEAAAGSGKTTTARAIADAHAEAGWSVIGIAPTGRAARELADQGLHAHTIHSLLRHPDRIPDTTRPLLVIHDEAGMTPTREWALLASHLLARQDVRIVQLGDSRQLASVAAGGFFADHVQQHEPRSLTQNHRQSDALERELVAALRSDDPIIYLAGKARAGELELSPNLEDATLRAAAWWHDRAGIHGAGETVVITRRIKAAKLVNHEIRRSLIASGTLGAAALMTPRGELRQGDRIITRRNDHEIGVTNGTRGSIARVKSGGVEMLTDQGERIFLPRTYLDEGHVHHAYALTTHAMQGATTSAALVLSTVEDPTHNQAYVAATRARHETRHLIVAQTPDYAGALGDYSDLAPGDAIVRLLDRYRVNETPTLASRQLEPELVPSIGDER